MKRLIIAILILFLVATPAFCELLNTSELNVEELLSLRQEIDSELFNRNSMLMYPGTYTVGQNIEPGDYIMNFFESEKENKSTIFVFLYNNEESFKEQSSTVQTYIQSDGVPFFMSLSEGNIIVTERGILSAIPAN